MENTFSPHDLDVFSRTVDRAGIEGLPTDVIDHLADSAVDQGASPVAAEVARSESEPRVARERALLFLVARLIGRNRANGAVDETVENDEFCLA